jgi:hypothetical protein
MATIAHGRGTTTPGTIPAVATRTETATAVATGYVFAGLRLALGWLFLWAFVLAVEQGQLAAVAGGELPHGQRGSTHHSSFTASRGAATS